MYTIRIYICIALDYSLVGILINTFTLLTVLLGRENHTSFSDLEGSCLHIAVPVLGTRHRLL